MVKKLISLLLNGVDGHEHLWNLLESRILKYRFLMMETMHLHVSFWNRECTSCTLAGLCFSPLLVLETRIVCVHTDGS